VITRISVIIEKSYNYKIEKNKKRGKKPVNEWRET
jgi:hypothetical protein